MYPYKYIIPNNTTNMYRSTNTSNFKNYPNTTYGNITNTDDDRFFWAPFVVGGLAGTALGYGIANNNQINNNRPCCGFYPYPPAPNFYPNYPTYNNTNFYY